MDRDLIEQTGGVSVEVRQLCKSFGENRVLQEVDLTVNRGETMVIIGGSGCGKSVLLKHIVGLLTPDSGRILIDGQGLHSPGIRERYRLGMVFQSSALFNSLTVGENVGLWLREHRVAPVEEIGAVVAEKLELVGLAGKQDLMPAELSGGMRKRVAIARALAMVPHLILYDEPTAELDPVITGVIADVILDLKKRLQITSIVVTHNMNFGCYIADRIGMLHGGQIIEVGTPAEIQRSTRPEVRAFLMIERRGIEGGT